MKDYLAVFLSVLLAMTSLASAEDLEPRMLKKGPEVIKIDHSDTAAAKKLWRPYQGSWLVTDGVMRAASASRTSGIANASILVDSGNKVFQFRARFVDNGDLFHFGFNPDREKSEKDGNLFSLIVTDRKATLLRHADKRPEKRDPEKELDSTSLRIKKGNWMVVMMEVKDAKAIVQIMEEGGRKAHILEGADPSFSGRAGYVVFRALGASVEFDDLKFWEGQ